MPKKGKKPGRKILPPARNPNVAVEQAARAAAPMGGAVVRPRAKARIDVQDVRDRPEMVVRAATGRRPTVEELFPGADKAALRTALLAGGKAYHGGREIRALTRLRDDGQHEVLMMSGGKDEGRVFRRAEILRNPGPTQDLIDAFDDFQSAIPRDKPTEVAQFWTIYDNDGVTNASVNKIAALMATGGAFKVRSARKGKKQKAREELQAILDEVNSKVNNAPADGVVTGARGLKMVTQQAVRQLLVEGDWFGRTVWNNHEVPTLGKFSLPMEIQAISAANMVPIPEIVATGREIWYWKPDRSLLNQLDTPKDAVVRDLLKKFVDNKTLSELKKNGQVLLDPALLMHIKHRGVYGLAYGTSFIKPALFGIAYKRAIEQLDFVMTNSLVNRLTIIKVGSSDPNSPYSDPSVAQERQALMQSFVEDPGPNMMIVWQGDDVDVQDVGSHNQILDLVGRHVIGDRMKKTAFGMPDALLTGSAPDGKSSAFAALLSAGSTLEEAQSAFEQVYSTLGQRVADENGYVDSEIIYEFDNGLVLDHAQERNLARQDYLAGPMSIRSMISARGQDPDAEFRQACFEKGLPPETTLWKDAFAPPTGLPGQGAGPQGSENNPSPAGRPPGNQRGNPPSAPTEDKSPEPNK